MTQEAKKILIERLQALDGETVLRLILNFHGEQLLTDDFAGHCVDEDAIDEDGLGLIEDDDLVDGE